MVTVANRPVEPMNTYGTDAKRHEVRSMGTTSFTLDNNYVVEAESDGYADEGLFKLAAGGHYQNMIPIRGITKIEIEYAANSAWVTIEKCCYDYDTGNVVSAGVAWVAGTEQGTTFDFSNAPIDYFSIHNTDEEWPATIVSMHITYSCVTATYGFSASFTPNWNSISSNEPADIYIAGSPELVSDGIQEGAWKYKKMDFSDGVYSYSKAGLPTGKYGYGFYAVEKDAAFNWNNPCDEGSESVYLDSDLNDTTERTWSYEPGAFSLTFVLDFGVATNINWLALYYKTLDDDNAAVNAYDGNWTGDSKSFNVTSGKNTYTVAPDSLSYGAAIYFFFRTWDVDQNANRTIGGASAGEYALRYVPKQKGPATITINMSNYASDKESGWFVPAGSVSISDPEMGSVSVAKTATESISHMDVSTTVYGTATISPSFKGSEESFAASYSGENIRIDGNSTIVGLKAGTTTEVTLTSESGLSCTFDVKVASSTYAANYDTNFSSDEGWFDSTPVSEISELGSSTYDEEDFYHGMDISSFKALVDNGAHFYNQDGVEQHLLYILKDAGANWVRLRLWVDPKTTTGVSYGGGECDLDHVLWMAKEAKAAGLKILLDLHYSDFWTDPGKQTLPKSWNEYSDTVDHLCEKIQSYTTETLTRFQDEGCLPEMVQLGNEISNGIYKKYYDGGDSEAVDQYGTPGYESNGEIYAYNARISDMTARGYFLKYIKAASNGVRAVSSSIKRVLHWAKSESTVQASGINTFFYVMDQGSDAYDYAAISYYPYWCFSSFEEANSLLDNLSLTKPWFIAETSYPFSGGGYVTGITNFVVSNWSTDLTGIQDTYAFNSAGQANVIHDLTKAVASHGGRGIFYWEPAWIPNANVLASGEGSKNSWGNQGFFSFDGKAIANLDLFAQMSPKF